MGREKWACRGDTKKTFVLTTGNGSQHAIVIQGAGVGLDLEDLAAADAGMLALRETGWPSSLSASSGFSSSSRPRESRKTLGFSSRLAGWESLRTCTSLERVAHLRLLVCPWSL